MEKSNNRLSEEACLIKMFKYFDIYDRGSVEFIDWYKSMEKIGLYYPEKDMLALFNIYDQNKNGSLDYQEFAEIIFGAGASQKGQMAKKQGVDEGQVRQLVEVFRKKVLQRGAKGIIGL